MKISKPFQNIRDFILDVLFPISCLSCQKEAVWLCDECFDKIPLKNNQVCPFCEKNITPTGRVCFSCLKKSHLDGLLVASSYKNEIISSAVHYYKYRFAEGLAPFLGKILIKSFLQSDLPLPEIIIPVPLHKRRLRWRGFNQSELLADCLSENLTPAFPIPVFNNLIIRKKYTHPQMKIKNHSLRRKNIENAFEINKKRVVASEDINGSLYRSAATPKQQNINLNNKNSQSINEIATVVRGELPRNDNALQDKKILLVDDIATTGSTLFECAKVLKSAGAREVFGIVIARQETKQ